MPFDEALPPVGEPAIIPLDELEGAEKLEALDTTVDPFFTRTSYNKTALGQEALPGLEMPQTKTAAREPQAAAAETTAAGEVSTGEETPAETPENPAQNQPENPAQNLPEPSGETAAQDPVAVAERQERLNNQILTVETEQEEAAAKGAAGEEK